MKDIRERTLSLIEETEYINKITMRIMRISQVCIVISVLSLVIAITASVV